MGDTVLENPHARFVIGFGKRVISPCSYDGNVIDVQLRGSDEWAVQGDVLGEICLLLNVGQTFAPEYVEILADGSEGYGLVALTGRVELLDFLNVRHMVEERFPGIVTEFPVDPDRLLPVSITVYYLLGNDDRALRVLTAIRNDGDEVEFLAASHLVMSGSTGGFFNPLSGTNGFGYRGLGADNLTTAPVPFLAYLAENSSYAYVPKVDPRLNADLPVGGGMVGISGVLVSTFDSLDVLSQVLARPDQVPRTPGFRSLEPGEVTVFEHSTWVGDGSLATMVDGIWNELGLSPGEVSGRLVDATGLPVGRATVTALDAKWRAFNQVKSSADGRFSLRLPPGDYQLRARFGEGASAPEVAVRVDSDGEASVGDIELPTLGELKVNVRDPDGRPVPGRLTVLCDGSCPSRPGSSEREQSFLPPDGYAAIRPASVAGEAFVRLAPGAYRVVVSRGMTWSTFPSDALSSGGLRVELVAGESVQIEAEIAPVVDTGGTLSADFHIHAMGSSDSNVHNEARVADFLSEGLDVMVSSDHDYVTDFRPAIAALGAQAWITSVVGNEITTPNIGHINAFPLRRDENARKGGPIDWSNGPHPNLTPAQLFATIREHPGEQVIQINHPAGSGTFGALQADVLTGRSFVDRAWLRMPEAEPDPVTGDTGLWSDDFTALEVMNGHGQNNFWSAMRWWLTMIGRGFSPTATAVTDTHSLYGDIGASPRSFVFMGPASDSVTELELPKFVEAINGGRLLGTNGPFFRAELRNQQGAKATLGATVETRGSPLTLVVSVQTPEWMRVDTIDVYSNVADDLIGRPGEALTHRLNPTLSVPVSFSSEDLVEVARGHVGHRRFEKTVEVPLELDTDGYVVVAVRNAGALSSMFPILRNGSVRPFAFSNPIFVDADGGGYDKPPLAELRRQRMDQPVTAKIGRTSQRLSEAPGGLTPAMLGEIIERNSCDHQH